MADGALSLCRLLGFEVLATRSWRNFASRAYSSSINLANKNRKIHLPRFTATMSALREEEGICKDEHKVIHNFDGTTYFVDHL